MGAYAFTSGTILIGVAVLGCAAGLTTEDDGGAPATGAAAPEGGTSTGGEAPQGGDTGVGGAASCGDSVCGTDESCASCPADCGMCCGDGACDESQQESCSTCPADCGACCGDAVCDAAESETCSTCPADCGDCCMAAIDQSWTVGTQTVGTAAEYFGNSFTAAASGELTRLDVKGIITPGSPTVNVEIYSGGVCTVTPCGPLLLSESHPFAAGDNEFTLTTPVPVAAGSVYTWRLYSGVGISATMDELGSYQGGQCLAYAGYDLHFATWVDSCP